MTAIAPLLAITKLPDFVRICGMCKGAGQYQQSYYIGINPDRPYSSMRGPCEVCADNSMCEGPGFVYQTGAKVPDSVIAQVLTLNGIDLTPRDWLLGRTLAFPGPEPIALVEVVPTAVTPADPKLGTNAL